MSGTTHRRRWYVRHDDIFAATCITVALALQAGILALIIGVVSR